MRFLLLVTTVFFIIPFLPQAADAEVRLFTGTLEVVTTSGKACAGSKVNHQISLVVGSSDSGDDIFGYVGGDAVTIGQLRGQSLSSLALRYPYPDERAVGHTLRIEINGSILNGELRDRHLDAAVDDCNFDLAHVKMLLDDSGEVAQKAYQRLALQYEAQLARSTAISISRTGTHNDAVPVFENALALADKLYPPDSERLTPYLTGLANSYIRAGKYTDFIALYNSRAGTLYDEAAQLVFSHHQIRSLLQVGRVALGSGEYQAALDNFRQALQIDYKNKDAIAATMSALVRSGQHDEAIAFLEETERKLDSDPDRKDVREAIALVEYQKARKDQKAGRFVEAERSLRKAIKLDPGTARYLVLLARLVHRSGKYTEADDILKRGLKTFKDEPELLELLEARDKMRDTELILALIRRSGL